MFVPTGVGLALRGTETQPPTPQAKQPKGERCTTPYGEDAPLFVPTGVGLALRGTETQPLHVLLLSSAHYTPYREDAPLFVPTELVLPFGALKLGSMETTKVGHTKVSPI